MKIGIILGRFSGMSIFELSLDPHSPGTWPGVRSLDLSNVKYNTAEGHAEDPWCSSSTKARCQTKACPWIAVHRLGQGAGSIFTRGNLKRFFDGRGQLFLCKAGLFFGRRFFLPNLFPSTLGRYASTRRHSTLCFHSGLYRSPLHLPFMINAGIPEIRRLSCLLDTYRSNVALPTV